ncbi:MAG: hypothetical protein U0821_17195 [Chloroflexota bacterium]
MSIDERAQLQAERGALQGILANIPEEDVLDRGSFLGRLGDVERRLAGVAADSRAPARARLTFRGRPVVDGHGIFADFGMSATKAFADAVSMMAAATTAPLAPTGPIPNHDRNQLLVTSTAVGSFGFELEEYRGDQLALEEETPVSIALGQAQELLQGVRGTDEELADAATVTDPRAVAAVRSFLETLVSSEAVCALEFRERSVSFADVGEVRRSVARLGHDNLREEEQRLEGAFQGVLPRRRQFEFKLAASDDVITGDVITGTLGPSIADPDSLNAHLHELARIRVTALRVGSGRPRYVLSAPPEWLGSERLPRPESV